MCLPQRTLGYARYLIDCFECLPPSSPCPPRLLYTWRKEYLGECVQKTSIRGEKIQDKTAGVKCWMEYYSSVYALL